MKNRITILLLIFIGSISAQESDLATKYAETITAVDMREDLTILASDALEGRETGKRGQKMAAAYIRAHFEELGLEGPVKVGNGYYQDVKLLSSKPGEIYLKIGDKTLTNLNDFLYYGDAQNTEKITSDVVFVGGGSAEEFESVDVEGKAILFINTERGKRREALNLAEEKGAKIAFAVRSLEDEAFNSFLSRYGSYFGRESLGLEKEDSQETSGGAFYISPLIAGEIFGKSFDDLINAIEKFKAGKTKALKKIKPQMVGYKISYTSKQIISENVLGYLEGSDLKDELLVLTAHYDHIGITNGQINNGADDDGSGTVAVMDIAEAFVKAKADGNGPRRSILFMTVTGEEKGLLGSAFYADNPVLPLENTVVDLNIDMVGRIGTVFKDKGESKLR